MYSKWTSSPYDLELYHHGVKGMKWGVRKDRYVGKSYKKANEIYSTLSRKEKQYLTAEKKPPKEYVTKDEYYSKKSQNVYSSIEQDKGKPVSVIDLWDGGDGGVDVSIAVRNDPNYRGKGYASRAVKRGIEWFNEHPEVEYMVWGVNHENSASIELAKKNGFELYNQYKDGWDTYILEKKH